MSTLSTASEANAPESNGDRFLICGLGRLGQECVIALKNFGVVVSAIEKRPPAQWELSKVPQLLDTLIVGDCRQPHILEQAQIQTCRTVLIVTSDEEVNAQTTLAVRQLNPSVRIVVRSAAHNLNQLLSEQLGNFFAAEPTQMIASAFGLAGLGAQTLGFFELEGQNLQVIAHRLEEGHRWCNARSLQDLNTSKRRVLFYLPRPGLVPDFYQWNPQKIVRTGDTVVYVEVVEKFSLTDGRQGPKFRRNGSESGRPQTLGARCRHLVQKQLFNVNFWQLQGQKFKTRFLMSGVRKVAIINGVIVLVLLILGTTLFKFYYPNTTWLYAFYATGILLLGDYGELFGHLEPVAKIPPGLQLFAFTLTLVGTAFVGVLYALLTEAILSSKFELLRRRPPIPKTDHLILVGLDRLGQQVASFLDNLEQAIVAIPFNPKFDQSLFPHIPLVVGNLTESLTQANVRTAKSVIITTNNEMLNLEIALMARRLNPNTHLVIGTYGQGLSRYLSHLLTNVQILGTYEVAAEAFAGAAFGENIISLFRYHQTILVTEYQIEPIDTLHGLLISEVAYGYGVVVVLHQTSTETATLMPSDDLLLAVGDRIVVLSAIEGLKRIEQGTIAAPTCQVRIDSALSMDSAFDGANVIARIVGYRLSSARELMNNLPHILPKRLYLHQAERLVRELKRSRVKAQLIRP
ncbi:NAD-binding protein [Roseofilum sp. BLCC_M91]|uniref:NAD-binding protein n=1 Tax=Roseofilum halophilum BLCC-M91 TaxID=3022259 RepID=A0ABT7BLQ3_9CYAN|nr:NAD-binding protein [Roseofilum halophilum]MDJ1179391.1 NAD-binding protein [Roseofilum halophilum BLCC-M91]